MAEEMEIVRRMSVDPPRASQVLTLDELVELQREVDGVFVHHAVAEYAVRLVMATRDPARWGVPELAPMLAHGASPRGSLGLVQGARALALLRGRDYVLPGDVHDLAVDVLGHRLVLTYEALADGVPATRIVERVLEVVEGPQISPGAVGLRARARAWRDGWPGDRAGRRRRRAPAPPRGRPAPRRAAAGPPRRAAARARAPSPPRPGRTPRATTCGASTGR